MFKKFVLLLFIIIHFSTSETSAKGCPCYSDVATNSLRLFCVSQWVADFTVTKVNVKTGYYEYNINYTKAYKMPPEFNETYPTKIYSDLNLSRCGMKLFQDKKYLLAGWVLTTKYYDGRTHGGLKITGCSVFNTEFQENLRNNFTVDCSMLKKDGN